MTRLFFLSVLILIACSSEYGTDFVIVNNSFNPIDSLTISTMNNKSSVKIKNLAPNMTKHVFLDMRNIDKIDGHFKFDIFTGSKKKHRDYGYYTNGMREARTIDLIIQSDTIILSHRPHRIY